MQDAGCYVDASLSAFAASDAAGAGCAACVQNSCTTGIKACSTSCTCITLFTCLADAGVTASGLGASTAAVGNCVPGGLASLPGLLNDPGIQGVYQCFTVTCASACGGVLLEGGAPGDDGGEAGTPQDAGASTPDGGTTVDAAGTIVAG